jgi:hypothetical protein
VACLFPWLFAPPASTPSAGTEVKKVLVEDGDDQKYSGDAQGQSRDNKEVISNTALGQDASTSPELPPQAGPDPTLSKSVTASQKDETPSTTSACVIKEILKNNKNKLQQEVVSGPSAKGGKRSLFSNAYTNEHSSSNNKDKNNSRKLEFSRMARVVTIESSQNLSPSEKADAWWQPNDYADFKKTARLVAKAMFQGGSEVWLMTNPSWKSKGHGHEEQKEEPSMGDKWWCKFGHSRRGLEHIASPEEGKERQRIVLQSKLAVIQEQSRQKRSNLWMDANRIRQIYVHHNFWSRELCLAAGASDAEAVRSNFHDESRSRAFYLREHQSGVGAPKSNYVPEFMDRLCLEETNEKIHEAPAPSATTAGSMSKKAVAFGTCGRVDMSGVLSGMGV